LYVCLCVYACGLTIMNYSNKDAGLTADVVSLFM
jgi:hypothetical protein